MPCYIYENPETGKTKEVYQSMTEDHTYSEEGVVWKRVWNTVEAAQNTHIDPFSQNAFVDKLGNSKGSMGDAWDRSAEMSEKRAAKNGGVDPVKEKHYAEYAKLRNGQLHPRQIKERIANAKIRI